MKWLMLLAALVWSTALADDGQRSPRTRSARSETAAAEQRSPRARQPSRRPRAEPALGRETERAALEFARKEYAELVDLLERLRKEQPRLYRRAILDLARTRRELQGLRKRDPKRYELQLELWKAQTRVRLLTAQLALALEEGKSQELAECRQALRDALKRQIEADIALRKQMLEQLRKRQEQLEGQLQDLERQLRSLDQAVKRAEQMANRLRRQLKRRPAERPRSRATATPSRESDPR